MQYSRWCHSISVACLTIALCQSARAQFVENAPEPASRLGGSLILHGGGKLDQRVRDTFVELAGGDKAKLVIIPSAAGQIDGEEELLKNWKSYTVASINVLHADSRDMSESDAILQTLQAATGFGSTVEIKNVWKLSMLATALSKSFSRS